ncbi:unnamed protein product, partial [Mesorhabditis spiculigera]
MRIGGLFVVWLITHVVSWDADELALYDLVEEVNQNFYEFFGIVQSASLSDVKKSYRRLSLEWHPDRNKAENASQKFRQVVSIYEVLKSPEMREKYHEILVNGLPTWRSGVYYYRHVRKMGLWEALLLLFILMTGVHYLMLWGVYFEKYLVETQRKVKVKKEKERAAILEQEAERVEQVLYGYRPTFNMMLPALMWRGCLVSVELVRELLKKEDPPEEPEPEKIPEPIKPSQPRPVYTFEMADDIKPVLIQDEDAKKKYEDEQLRRDAKYTKKAAWTCEELVALVKLNTEKFPAGTPNRWELIAQALDRTPEDVTVMDEYNKLLTGQTSNAVTSSVRAGQIESPNDQLKSDWTQEEQKSLEAALVKYTKAHDKRWEAIASEVGTRSKAECVARFKFLSEMVRKRKDAST